MESDLIASIAEGLAHRHYSLLTGAGASASARSRDGRPLPTSGQLLQELDGRFSLPEGASTSSLASVFQYLRSTDSDGLVSFLRERFLNCRPSEGHRRIVRLPWQRIWTLNVDDVMEVAAADTGVTHNSVYLTHDAGARPDRDAIEIVHLHGAIDDVVSGVVDGTSAVDALERVVLDWQSYGQRTSAPRSWQHRFEDDIAESPFVVLGARLVDEIDFWRLFERMRGVPRNEEFPSAVVLSESSDFDKSRLEEELGLKVLNMTTEQFATQVEEAHRRVLALSAETLGAPVGPVDMGFLQQFIDLRREKQASSSETSRVRFYQGWAPTWPVVRYHEADAELDATQAVGYAVVEHLKTTDPEPRVFLLTGGPGTGKSTALLRIASDALQAGFSPWLFRGDERLQVESAVGWSAKQHTSLLLVDDLADFASDVGETVQRAMHRGTHLVIVAAIRDQRRGYAIDQIGSSIVPTETALGTLTTPDVRRLVAKLEAAGLLGKLTRSSWQQRDWFFLRQHRGQLFSALAEITEGPGFANRIKTTFEKLGGRERDVLAPVALTHNFGHPLKLAIVARVVGMAPSEVAAIIDGGLRGLIVKERSGLFLTHRMVASLFLQECFTPSERFHLALGVANSLAPHVDRRQLVNRSRASRIVRELVTARNVRWLCGPQNAGEFYASLETPYGWNGRFWDQRAIWYLEENDLSLARTYAEKSVAVHRHPFALTLLGQILFAMARRSGDGELLVEAEDSLRQARDDFTHWHQWDEDRKPFEVFFDGLLGFRSVWGAASIDPLVSQRWPEWIDRARASRIPSVLQRLDGWREEWDSLHQTG
ncbi:MAG: SIR2 family protein [Bryobacterales bacterium]|nr:SIR2 family protein [Bryobacterales bacterium]